MKKILLAIFISTGFSLVLNAQSKFSIGPNAGIGSASISNTTNSKSKLAGNAGLSLVYSAAEHFGIGIDAKFSFEGARSELGTYKNTVDLNYIRIPVKAIYFFNNYGNRLRPKAAVGPSFGFLTRAYQRIQSGTNIGEGSVKSYYNSFDFGMLGSAGFNYRLVKNTWFNADVTYIHGISVISPNSDNHNRNLGVNIGVNFGL